MGKSRKRQPTKTLPSSNRNPTAPQTSSKPSRNPKPLGFPRDGQDHRRVRSGGPALRPRRTSHRDLELPLYRALGAQQHHRHGESIHRCIVHPGSRRNGTVNRRSGQNKRCHHHPEKRCRGHLPRRLQPGSVCIRQANHRGSTVREHLAGRHRHRRVHAAYRTGILTPDRWRCRSGNRSLDGFPPRQAARSKKSPRIVTKRQLWTSSNRKIRRSGIRAQNRSNGVFRFT